MKAEKPLINFLLCFGNIGNGSEERLTNYFTHVECRRDKIYVHKNQRRVGEYIFVNHKLMVMVIMMIVEKFRFARL